MNNKEAKAMNDFMYDYMKNHCSFNDIDKYINKYKEDNIDISLKDYLGFNADNIASFGEDAVNSLLRKVISYKI
jgi:putative IMPACT (imprinted ancient) family translation regulator